MVRRPPPPLEVGVRPKPRRPDQEPQRRPRPPRDRDPRDRDPGQDSPPPRPPGSSGMPVRLEDEQKLCGLNACRAVFAQRPQDLVKVYVQQERVKELGPLLQWCAQNKRAYKIVGEEELRKISESTHHEGVCVVVRKLAPRTLEDVLGDVEPDAACCLLGLENVENPHNLGAILRVAAHFGVRDVLCLGATPHQLNAALARTAEGAAEHARLIPVPDALAAIRSLQQAGFTVLATSHRGATPLYDAPVAARAVWLLGSEGQGLGPSVLKAANGVVAIPGSGAVESLNVACATTALLGEWWRQHHRAG